MNRIGRYDISGELGRGGCGVVYLGKDPRMNRKVAIKTILTRELQNAEGGSELQMRLTREAQSAGSLNHSSIVTVYELAEENDLTFIVMEYVEGQPLDNLMRQGPLTWSKMIQILKEAAAGLDFAHSRGIIHRDVKPGNILIPAEGPAKISDFGVAKISELASMTMTGMAVGTPSYMSPEQILTKPLTGAADQFALGVIAFEMLTGKKPFHSDSFPGLIHQILSVEPPNAAELNAIIPMDAARVVARALRKEAGERFRSCTEFVDALHVALIGGGASATGAITLATNSTTPELPLPIHSTGLSPWKLGAAGGAIAVLVFAVFIGSRPSREVPEVPRPSQSLPASLASESPPPIASAAVPLVRGQDPVRRDPSTAGTASRPTAVAPKASTPIEPVAADPGPDEPATSYMGSPEGRFGWAGSLPPGERLVIVRNRVRAGSISGNSLPPGVGALVEVRPADIRVVEQPSSRNGFRLILMNQTDHPVTGFSGSWRELAR